MRRLLLIAFCLCQSQALPALEQVATPGAAGASSPLSSLDRPRAARPESSPKTLFLDAELGDREGRAWRLQWTLLGDDAGGAGGDAHFAWRAAVVLTAPDGRGHEKTFFADADHDGRLVAARDWEWRSRGEALLPAKLRFDVDGREVILLLEELDARGADAGASRVRLRGFVNVGLHKTFLSGGGRLDRERRLVAGSDASGSHPAAYPVSPSGE